MKWRVGGKGGGGGGGGESRAGGEEQVLLPRGGGSGDGKGFKWGVGLLDENVHCLAVSVGRDRGKGRT